MKRLSIRDIEFLFEIGSIRHIDRMWKRFGGVEFANLADHHFRVFWIATMIASAVDEDVDTEKIAKMALIHDIAESRTGDVDYIARQYTKRDEELGAKDMLGGTVFEKEMLEVLHEYEKRESLEAKIVKDADNLDVDLELREQAARGEQLAVDFQEKFRLKEKLYYTDVARQLFEDLADANPNDWHLKGRNRVSDGDWGKGKT